MRQLVQHLGNGNTLLLDVPSPGCLSGNVRVQTAVSLVSAGTERMLVQFGKSGWIGKARQQPEKVKAVFAKIKADGVTETARAIHSKLQKPIPLGYCNVGIVLTGTTEVKGESGNENAFYVGDRVVSNAPHAEIVSVPEALCARIPANVADNAATFTPLAAIALEGINLLSLAPGDTVVVTGLGLIGQLAVRILLAKSCRVLGFDPDPARCELARRFGAAIIEGDSVSAALHWTTGKGVAGVLITASTASNEVVNEAARCCRYRGKVVLVGVVGLRLNRADFYRNEVSFQVSNSYGLRRSDHPHLVRANFDCALNLMAQGKLPVEDLITHQFEFEDAHRAYAALTDRSALGIVMRYRHAEGGDLISRSVKLRAVSGLRESHVALIGAGNFATRTLLPVFKDLSQPVELVAVCSVQGVHAMLAAQEFGAARATTDEQSILSDPTIDAVFITNRHNAHARHAISALRSGKHVWVEKPLALSLEDVAGIEEAIRSGGPRGHRAEGRELPVLMVGFNRRFAPIALRLRNALNGRKITPRFKVIVNAGRLEPDHWVLDPTAGGGRIVGEACHFVDLLRFLADSAIERVICTRRDLDGQDGGCFELAFSNGATGVIDYRTDLSAHLPKEFVEIEGAGFRGEIHNWARLTSIGLNGISMGWPWSRHPRKGHREALQAFLAATRTGGASPIPLEQILEVSRWAICMQAMKTGDVQIASGLKGVTASGNTLGCVVTRPA